MGKITVQHDHWITLHCDYCKNVYSSDKGTPDDLNFKNNRNSSYDTNECYELRKDAQLAGWVTSIEIMCVGDTIISDVVIDRCPDCVQNTITNKGNG